MECPAEEQMLLDLAEGREEAFAALYDRFASALYRVASVMLASRQDAEDAVQEVFVGLVRVRWLLPRVENLRSYLFASLRSAVGRIAGQRKKERRTTIPDFTEVAAHESPALDLERSAWLESALLALPAEQRELVALKVDGGLTFAEIASCLGISANTAASRYRYALENCAPLPRNAAMKHPELPPELAELEGQLSERPCQEPGSDFRPRVLGAVCAALQRDTSSNSGSFWRFASTIAAAMLLAINSSMSVANNMDWHLAEPPVATADEVAEQLHELLPELSAREVRRQGLFLRARTGVVPIPILPGHFGMGVPFGLEGDEDGDSSSTK